MNEEDRIKLINDLVQNIGNLDAYVVMLDFFKFLAFFLSSEAQKDFLIQLMNNDLLPPEERERIIKDLVANISNLDRYENILN